MVVDDLCTKWGQPRSVILQEDAVATTRMQALVDAAKPEPEDDGIPDGI